MKTILFACLSVLIGLTASGQTKEAFNFDFENTRNGIPTGWMNLPSANYVTALDSVTTQSGKYSVSIEYVKGNLEFNSWTFILPDNYEGKRITLTGYIKTENVTDGYAGLWMRIDPSVAFDNMKENGVKGTTDWKKYEISLDMDPDKTKKIVMGGLLVGKGKAWFDHFTVSIDGKAIQNLKPYVKKLLPADNDKEFDKGSGIAEIPLNKTQIENLTSLGMIWGFLKYYHPKIAAGTYNWDYELFRILPQILKAENKKNRDEILVKWIENLGELTPNKKAETLASAIKIKPDLDWLSDAGFSEALTAALVNVKNASRPKEHYYIGLQAGAGNPDFKNENSYAAMRYPDAGFRLLALYRYWNIIEYYFPYKNLIEEDWREVLKEFIPRFCSAKDETAYTLTTLELIGRIHDSHASVWGDNQALKKYFGMRYAPIELTFVENKCVVTGYYNVKAGKATGLEPGDVIVKINDKAVDEIVKEKLKFTPASNYPTQLRNLAPDLMRTNDTVIHIEYTRADLRQHKTLKTLDEKEVNLYAKYKVTDTSFRLINKDIAYLNNGSLKGDHLPKIWSAVENTKGLIIDIRNYPYGFPIYALSDYLMPKRTPFVKFTNGSIENPGYFTFIEALEVGRNNKNYYKGKVVILVNEISQSSAEFHAMAYRVHPNATVIGSTTSGADGNVSEFYLPGGIFTMITGIGVYYPDGKETQRVGIQPDIELRPTIQGIKEGRDELMEKAIQVINQQ
jgi:C-terminal processing protease CtpA/Prc